MSRIFLTVEKCSSKTTLLTALLACVIAAAAGVRSGYACTSFTGLGFRVSCTQVSLCTGTYVCVQYCCDGSTCGVGQNCGQQCVFFCSDAQCSQCVAQNIRKEGQ